MSEHWLVRAVGPDLLGQERGGWGRRGAGILTSIRVPFICVSFLSCFFFFFCLFKGVIWKKEKLKILKRWFP